MTSDQFVISKQEYEALIDDNNAKAAQIEKLTKFVSTLMDHIYVGLIPLYAGEQIVKMAVDMGIGNLNERYRFELQVEG